MKADPINLTALQNGVAQVTEVFNRLADINCLRPLVIIRPDKPPGLIIGQFFRSVVNTLASVVACCKSYAYADANTLVRKYRDDLFLYLYILETMENQLHRIRETGECIMGFGDSNVNEQAISAWVDNAVCDHAEKRCIAASHYWKTLNQNTIVCECVTKHMLEGKWHGLSARQNDYVHNNGEAFLIANHESLANFYPQRARDIVNQLLEDILTITSLFLAILILIKPSSIGSADYDELIGCTQDEIEYCLSLIDSSIQGFLDEHMCKLHPDLKGFLKVKNPSGMLIE